MQPAAALRTRGQTQSPHDSDEGHATDGVTEETWLVFSREVSTSGGVKVGYAELAFRLEKGESDGDLAVRAVSGSPLVVFFPTILPTVTYSALSTNQRSGASLL